MRTLPRSLAFLPLCLAAQLPVEAQSVELGPTIGAYLPMGSFQNPAYFSTALPENPSDLSGLQLGGHARVRLTRRFGVQLEANLASSHVGGGATPIGDLAAVQAQVFLASAGVTYHLTDPGRHHQVWLSAGPGLVRYGGRAYAPFGHPTQFAGVGGLGASVPLSRRIRAELGASLAIYHLSIHDTQGASLERGMQFDSRLQAGLSLVWP